MPKKETHTDPKSTHSSLRFGCYVFDRAAMEEMLPKNAFEELELLIRDYDRIDFVPFEAIAEALKIWALKQGATHYTHWFQPFSSSALERQDSFLFKNCKEEPMEQFCAKELVRGELEDFSSEGVSAAHRTKGHVVWNLAAPPFFGREKRV